MATPTEIIVLGAGGRMGRMVLEACARRMLSAPAELRVTGAITSAASSLLGRSTGVDGIGLSFSHGLEGLLGPNSVIIDFSSPKASLPALDAAVSTGAAMVLCTTGFNEDEKQRIAAASKTIPLVMAPNMSIGVTLMFRVAERVAKILGPDFDVEIVEAHHNQKKDAPSGTALGFAEAVARGHGVNLKDKASYGREGISGARPKGEIGIHAVRGGDIVGDHTVLFAGDGERIELKHMAHSRQTFAQGAVKAALFLKGKAPGMYTMFDVLGI